MSDSGPNSKAFQNRCAPRIFAASGTSPRWRAIEGAPLLFLTMGWRRPLFSRSHCEKPGSSVSRSSCRSAGTGHAWGRSASPTVNSMPSSRQLGRSPGQAAMHSCSTLPLPWRTSSTRVMAMLPGRFALCSAGTLIHHNSTSARSRTAGWRVHGRIPSRRAGANGDRTPFGHRRRPSQAKPLIIHVLLFWGRAGSLPR